MPLSRKLLLDLPQEPYRRERRRGLGKEAGGEDLASSKTGSAA